MKQILSYILDNMLDDNKSTVEEEETDGYLTLKAYVPKDQMGKIIGKNGRIINSIKNYLKIKAVKEGIKIDVQVIEQGE